MHVDSLHKLPSTKRQQPIIQKPDLSHKLTNTAAGGVEHRITATVETAVVIGAFVTIVAPTWVSAICIWPHTFINI